jgi:tetratricopeptide (TPR) repeat protein
VAGLLLLLLLLFVVSVAVAASRFVAGSRVSGDESEATIEIDFICKVTNVRHDTPQGSDQLRLYFETTQICNGVAPSPLESRGRFRPADSELAALVEFEYEDDLVSGPMLTLNFSEPVNFSIEAEPLAFRLLVTVSRRPDTAQAAGEPPDVLHRQVVRQDEDAQDFVINLVSMQRPPTLADVPDISLTGDRSVFYTEVEIDGATWYRLRLGQYASNAEAQEALAALKADYPGAWIDHLDEADTSVDLTVTPVADEEALQDDILTAAGNETGATEIEQLMEEARRTMVAGDRSRAIQIYTKILQMPPDPLQVDAQEYLALAREKNGQLAHAKAEYQRYLSLYPDSEGATRVNQRLSALVARDRPAPAAGVDTSGVSVARSPSDWRLQTFFSQYYRRDVNQQTDQDEIVSQSALYSDVNFDARRRGERYDFSARLTAGYRTDFLDEGFSSGNETRVSYAYVDLADAKTGVRGRFGRQSRNTGGVLGRFDGINLGYQLNERLLISGVLGKPAYSANDGVSSERTFYGASVNYSPGIDGLELGAYVLQQTIEGVDDRQAVGGEFRYFGANQSVWGMIDYDTLFNELGSAFLQTSWRIGSRLTLNGSFDRRHSPFLSTNNALIGQPVGSFSELTDIFSEDELVQLGLDRSPLSTSFTVGMSFSLSPRLQISADANDTNIDATPDSGGVFGVPASHYRYLSANLVASSLFREGDVSIVTLRQSSSETTDVLSISLDSRFPFGRSWRVNPRLRVDRRDRLGDLDYEWLYTPGLRVQYRGGQRLRVEFEAGKQYSLRQTVTDDLDRESYFISLGYQLFF